MIQLPSRMMYPAAFVNRWAPLRRGAKRRMERDMIALRNVMWHEAYTYVLTRSPAVLQRGACTAPGRQARGMCCLLARLVDEAGAKENPCDVASRSATHEQRERKHD